MSKQIPEMLQPELRQLLDLTQRVGNDPLLTQASTGNSSAKLDGALWIKASGKWMADAIRDDILMPLDLKGVRDCLRQKLDPAHRYQGASLETALHAALPGRMVLHVHCVNTIAWAVRSDGRFQLARRLDGLRWQWIPYVASGLPLSEAIESAVSTRPDTELFVLGNHGLVLCGEDTRQIDQLLAEVRRRVAIRPRKSHPADYAALWEMAKDSHWRLPDDDQLHALGTDPISQAILSAGLLYPCQAIFADPGTNLFRPVPLPAPLDPWQRTFGNRPFLIVEGCGVIVNKTIAPSELAMIAGLAQVIRRLRATTPLRYLTEAEIAAIPREAAHRYRELANTRCRRTRALAGS